MTSLLPLLTGCPSLPTEPTDTSPPTDASATGDTAQPPPTDCDAPFVGTGDDTLLVTPDALYCVMGVSDMEELSVLRRVAFTPGTYAWPATTGSQNYRLPSCIDDGRATSVTVHVGSLQRKSGFDSIITTYLQPYGLDERLETLRLVVDQFGASPPAAALDGTTSREDTGGQTAAWMTVCNDEDGCWSLVPCNTPQLADAPEQITFDRGHLDLHIDVVRAGAIYIDEPRLLYRAEGALDGTDFVQTDYFDLGYAYAAHGLDREFVVRFEDPIGAACGLWGRYGRPGLEVLRTVDCDGTPLEDLDGVVAPGKE